MNASEAYHTPPAALYIFNSQRAENLCISLSWNPKRAGFVSIPQYRMQIQATTKIPDILLLKSAIEILIKFDQKPQKKTKFQNNSNNKFIYKNQFRKKKRSQILEKKVYFDLSMCFVEYFIVNSDNIVRNLVQFIKTAIYKAHAFKVKIPFSSDRIIGKKEQSRKYMHLKSIFFWIPIQNIQRILNC